MPAGTKIRLEFANINNPLSPSASYKVTVTTRNDISEGITLDTTYIGIEVVYTGGPRLNHFCDVTRFSIQPFRVRCSTSPTSSKFTHIMWRIYFN